MKRQNNKLRFIVLGTGIMLWSITGFGQNTVKVTKQCLDSAILETNKYVFSYDERGNNTQTIRKSAITENIFDKYEYEYDGKGYLIVQTKYVWSDSKNDWSNSHKEEYTYDDKGNLIERIEYRGTSNYGEWEEYWKHEYEYDAMGSKTLDITYSYFCTPYGCGWNVDVMYKNYYTYDTKGNITECIIYLGMTPVQKYEYTYDNNGNVTLETDYAMWGGEYWKESHKYEYMYDNEGILTRTFFYDNWIFYYQLTGVEWQIQYEYAYNEKGNKTEYILYSDGEEAEKWEYTYDSTGNVTKTFMRTLSIYNVWLNYEYEYEYVYNLSYSETDLVTPRESNPNPIAAIYLYNVMVIERRDSHTDNGGNKYPRYTNTYYWSDREIEVMPQVTGLIITPASANLQIGQTQQFTALVTVINGADTSVTWSLSGQTSMLTNIDQNGLLTVGNNETATGITIKAVSNFNNAIFDEVTLTNTGIAETLHATSLRIYPNPTTGQLTIRNEELGMSGEIEIFDVVGRKLLSYTPLTSHSSPLIEIDISHLANGLYFLKIDGKMIKVVKN